MPLQESINLIKQNNSDSDSDRQEQEEQEQEQGEEYPFLHEPHFANHGPDVLFNLLHRLIHIHIHIYIYLTTSILCS